MIHLVMDFAGNNGFVILGLDHSPIKGPEGNIEYLLYLEKGNPSGQWNREEQDRLVRELVARSHAVL